MTSETMYVHFNLCRYSNSLDDVSSRELEDLITSCNMKVQTEKSLIEVSK